MSSNGNVTGPPRPKRLRSSNNNINNNNNVNRNKKLIRMKWEVLDKKLSSIFEEKYRLKSNPKSKRVIRRLFCRKKVKLNLSGEDDEAAWIILTQKLTKTQPRNKLPFINTIDDVVNLILRSSKIMILTGAGVSVSCGIPDFRSPNGLYSKISKLDPHLENPESFFTKDYFLKNPERFFRTVKEMLPSKLGPSPTHKFIKYIEIKNKLLRNYTQNIDTIEEIVGIQKSVTCHGSLSKATCIECGNYQVDFDDIKDDILADVIPRCKNCLTGLMKPNITFFDDVMPENFYNQIIDDQFNPDLFIVIGSSLKAEPVGFIPNAIPAEIPQILINRERLDSRKFQFDVELLGNCDDIIEHLCEKLGADWSAYCFDPEIGLESSPTGSLVNDEQTH